MNTYALIILITLVISYLINLLTNILNLSHLRTEVPAEFNGVYDEESYRKSQNYTREITKFGFLTSSFGIIITLIFWFSGGFNVLDLFVRDWNLNPVYTGLLYMGILIFARSIISLPFSVYSTFVIEERYGFNKTTIKIFILDLLKGALLSIIIGAPVLGILLYFFDYAGDLAWLYSWIVTVVFSLFLQYVAPTWIMPLFNKFTPLEDGELKDRITRYAESVRFPLRGIFVMDGSKRSTKSNAFFTGFGRNKRIALFDTLIDKHTVPELVAVLAHEIGHYKKRHILQGTLISIVHTGILFYLLSIFLSHQGLFDAFYMDNMSIYAGFIFFGMLYAPIEMILSILMHIFSRKNEFEADRYAGETIRDSAHMISALKKLSRDNLSNLTPHPVYVFLNYSHPPVLERIRALRNLTFDNTN